MVMATVSSTPAHKGLADVTNQYAKPESREPANDSEDEGYSDFMAFLGTPNTSPSTPSKKELDDPATKSTVVVEGKVLLADDKLSMTEDESATDGPSTPGSNDTTSIGDVDLAKGGDDEPTVSTSGISSDWSAAAAVVETRPAAQATIVASAPKEESKPVSKPAPTAGDEKPAAVEPTKPTVDPVTAKRASMAGAAAAEHVDESASIATKYFTVKAAEDKVLNAADMRELAKQNMGGAHIHFDKIGHEDAKKRASEIKELISAPRPAAIEYFTAMEMEEKARKEAMWEVEATPHAIEYFTARAEADKAKKAAEIQAMKENPPPASTAGEYFNKIEEDRQKEIERMMNEPAPPAIEYFTKKAEAERSTRELMIKEMNENPPPASVATQYFNDKETQKAEEQKAARSQVKDKEYVEPLPVDYFTKEGEKEMAEKARKAATLADEHMPIGIRYFTRLGEQEKIERAASIKALSESQAPVATRHFHRLAEEEAEAKSRASLSGEIDVMPAAIQHFTVADRAEKAKQKAIIEEMKENPPPMAPGQEYFTMKDRAEKEKLAAEYEAIKENPPMSAATEYFAAREVERQAEIEKIMNEPAPPAIEYFTSRANIERERSQAILKAMNDKPYEAPVATQHFVKKDEEKAAQIKAAREATRSKKPVEPLPADYFTKMGNQEMAEKAQAQKQLADSCMPIATKKFNEQAEVGRSTRALDTGLNASAPVATKHFHQIEEEKAAEAVEGPKDIMPAAIQKFSMMAMEERAAKKVALEELKQNPPPVPPGIAHFTPDLQE